MTPVTKYECSECYVVHDDREDALLCCPRKVSELFFCSECETKYEDLYEDEAKACCTEDDPEFESKKYKINQKKLEEAGQSRLF